MFFLELRKFNSKGEDLKDCSLEEHDTKLVVALIKYYIFVIKAKLPFSGII